MTDMTKTDTFAGRVALITGAGQGIGRVFAKGFARAGAKIAIVELNEDSGRSVAAEVEAECGAGTVIAIRADVADPAAVEPYRRPSFVAAARALYARLSGQPRRMTARP